MPHWLGPTMVSGMRDSPLTFQVSQGSAATDLRWGENFNELLFHNSFLNIVVKKITKIRQYLLELSKK